MNHVRNQMGDVCLHFVWVSTDRSRFKFINDTETMPCHAVWKKISHQMRPGFNHFCILTYTIDRPDALSGSTFGILGVLCTCDEETLQEWSKLYWSWVAEGADSEEKLMVTRKYSNEMKDWFFEGNQEFYNENTNDLIDVCLEDGLKVAKNASIDIIAMEKAPRGNRFGVRLLAETQRK